MQQWASRHHLTPQTLAVLAEHEFTSLDMLRHLDPSDVIETFLTKKLLPVAQCLVLKKALQELRRETGEATPAMGGGGGGRDICFEAMGGAEGGVGFEAAPPPVYHGVVQGTPFHVNYPSADEELRFLLLGKTGSGKSMSGNTILGADLFTVGMTFESVTDQCELCSNRHLGKTIQIMDSPGLFDTSRPHEEISIDIMKAVVGMHPGPHAILYVIPLGRYTDEEYAVYTRLKALFDEDLIRYLVVLFTGGDRLRGDSLKTMLNKTPKGLSQVLQECGQRYVLFDNMAANKQPQVEQLFRLVTDMNSSNGGKPYQCPKYKAVGQGLEEEVARRLAEVEKREAERIRYVQQLKEQTEAAEQAVQEELENSQRREAEREAAMQEEDEKRERKMAELMETMKEQQLSLEQQREEERKLRQQMEEERRQQMAKMQEQRVKEAIRLSEMEARWQERLRRQQEADRKLQRERDDQWKAELLNFKQEVTKTWRRQENFRTLMDGMVRILNVLATLPSSDK